MPPTLTFSPSAVRDVVRGEDLIVVCQGSADPSPTIKWFRGDQQLGVGHQTSVNASIVSQSIDGITTRSQLTVMGFTSEEAGVYSCAAVNALGNDSRSFQVNAVGEPPNSYVLLFINYVLYS